MLAPELLKQIRQQWQCSRTQLIQRFEASGRTRALLTGLKDACDTCLKSLFEALALPKSAALAAVGGFGRGELFPHSDVDVLLLIPTPLEALAPAERALLESFVTACWDAGLEIGFSVRTVDECIEEAQRDVTIRTALLEARRITGNAKLYSQFQRAYTNALDPQGFFEAKLAELRQRHTKYEGTPYALEPNCKESPGGLRDLHFLLWVARAAGYGHSWDAMAAKGLLSKFELQQIKLNERLLKLIRARLHIAAKRREDRLVFDMQASVAENFGYEATHTKRASERLMQRYYWAAKAVSQLNQTIRLNIGEQLFPQTDAQVQPINAHFGIKAGTLEVLDDKLYEQDSTQILKTFLTFVQTPGLDGLSARTYRALYNARRLMDSAFRANPENRKSFISIIQHGSGLTHAARLMNQTSVLGRYLWVFRRIVGQMQHDLFHVYTVDQHILMVLRNVRRFLVPEHAHEYPLCSQLAAEFERPWVLYVAALFHDIAKGRGGDHSDLGALEARKFCRDHGVTKADAKLVEFLVLEHLQMSRIAQKEDLSDPEVIRAFAKRVGDERSLTALYLLTVADVRGTSPKVWNAWKGKLLEDLYRLTLRVLGGHEPHPNSDLEAKQQEALSRLAAYALPEQGYTQLWSTLDVGYFQRHDASEVAWHTRQLWDKVDETQAVVRARLSPIGEGLQVLVYTPDKPDLFARICGYFDARNWSILDARVHTTRRGYALDTFLVVEPTLVQHYREMLSMMEVELAQTLNRDGQALEPPRERRRISRRIKSFPIKPRVEWMPDERAQRWLMSISASDKTGLLFSVAQILARYRINLQLAKITTLGERVEDTFLISGEALNYARTQLELERELIEAIKSE